MRQWIFSFCFLLSVVFASTAMPLDLELTQGIDAAQPIAVMPFQGEAVFASGHDTVDQIVGRDLQNSGQFRLVTSPQQPTGDDAANLAHFWRQQGADVVLTGHITPAVGGYKVTFQLISTVESGDHVTPLLEQSFTTTQSGLRRLSHLMSDAIYKTLTGVRGVFSTKIAYVLVQRRLHQPTQYRLVVSDIDGFDPKVILKTTLPVMSPAWSPDGHSLAYVSFEGRQSQIFVQNLQTGQRKKILSYPGINGAPAFSPDGHQLAVVLSTSGNPNIYIYDLLTQHIQQITKGYSIDTEPSWAPDGQSLLFTSNRGGTPQIYQYDFKTKRLARLSFSGNYNAHAQFLPNQRGLIMMHRDGGLFGIAKEQLPDGKTEVLTQSGRDDSPSVSPNGQMVVYGTSAGRRGVLGLVSVDGRVRLRLPAPAGDVQEPAWSPFLSH